jgi:hypothetical protein
LWRVGGMVRLCLRQPSENRNQAGKRNHTPAVASLRKSRPPPPSTTAAIPSRTARECIYGTSSRSTSSVCLFQILRLRAYSVATGSEAQTFVNGPEP